MKAKKLMACSAVVLLSCFHVDACHGQSRTWTSRRGTPLQAEFRRIAGGRVILLDKSGRERSVQVSLLSDMDQDYLRRLTNMRTWTVGEHKAEGRLVALTRDKVVILRDDGKKTKPIPLNLLSAADQLFVKGDIVMGLYFQSILGFSDHAAIGRHRPAQGIIV